jgi:hypothetical protein
MKDQEIDHIAYLYTEMIDEYYINNGDISLEVFEVQYYNKYNGNVDLMQSAININYPIRYTLPPYDPRN